MSFSRNDVLTIFLVLLALALASLPVQAATNDELDQFGDELSLFEDISSVYSASKYEQKSTEAPSSVKVITADEIKKAGYRTLADVLAGEETTKTPIIATMVMNKSDLEKYKKVTGVVLKFNLKEQIIWLQKILPETRNVGVLYSSKENRANVMVLNPKTAKNILLFSFRNKIPFIGLSNAWVKAGALYALERDYDDIGQQSAEQCVQVLSVKR
ncbi:MAG: hypothetical protein J7K90_05755 [Desulfuromusa sp.]|nr:hypothetical protein [Desulfuromusa sp.]